MNKVPEKVFKRAQDHAADLTSKLAQVTRTLEEMQIEKEALSKVGLEDKAKIDALEMELKKRQIRSWMKAN